MMNDKMHKAYALLETWKGSSYIHGLGVLDRIGEVATKFGKKALVVCNTNHGTELCDRVVGYLAKAGITLAGDAIAPGAKPNAPREDVYRIATYILQYHPDCIIAIGGGSTIDACKGADVVASLGKDVTPEIDHYFGSDIVGSDLTRTDGHLVPLIAVQTSASSGAHLTKYANITDPVQGQKKLIVDKTIVPTVGLFDYETSVTMPIGVTIDGVLDALAHTFEVFCGATKETYDLCRNLAETAISLCAEHTRTLIENPKDIKAREAIGLATDLGGYAIMVGGTSGAHLTSFSLVDIVGHGTACGIMNPYYAVFYSKAIQPQLQVIGTVFRKYGFGIKGMESLQGRPLAEAVAQAMIAFGKSIGAPTTLEELPGFGEQHIQRALTAARNPQLKMKLQNMPVPMTAYDIDTYMEPILRAAATGDLSRIKEM